MVADAPMAMRIFNGVYTIRNRVTNEHRTFRISTQSAEANFAPGQRILSLLVGPDNNSSYKGFAFVREEGIATWHKYRGKEGKRSHYEYYALMMWLLSMPEGQETITSREWKAKYELMVEKRCVRCNRRLTHPESLISGIGPDCAGRV